MAYRYEQNPDTGITELVIDGWERGISSGPYSIFSPSALGPINQTGMVDLSYVNIVGIPGEVSVNFPLVVSTIAGSPPKSGGQMVQVATGYAGGGATVSDYYMLDSYGQIFVNNTLGNTVTWTYQGNVGSNSTSVTGNSGIVWWQGYLFTLRGSAIYYSPDGGVTNTDWTATVGALISSGSTHYAISSKVKNAVYFCNGSGVGAIILPQGSTFDPTNAATYQFYGGTNPNVVTIPLYDFATCLAEINGQVLIGGGLNRVYPWDALDQAGTGITSATGLPLFLGDRYVQRIVVFNANAYIFCGQPFIPTGRGYIYIYSGSTIDVFQKMPDNLAALGGAVSDINTPYWTFGDAMFHRNQLMFGAVATGNISDSVIPDTGGVWCIDINSQALYRANFVSSNTDLVTAMTPNDTGTTIAGLGYVVGTSTGLLYNSTTILSTSGRIISDKIPVGTNLVPKTFSQLELKMAVALSAGESVTVSVVTDLDPSGHAIGTMNSTDGMSKVFTPLNLYSSSVMNGIQWLQVECLLNPTNTNPTFVRLREIRLR
jgi:hypothetical protein